MNDAEATMDADVALGGVHEATLAPTRHPKIISVQAVSVPEDDEPSPKRGRNIIIAAMVIAVVIAVIVVPIILTRGNKSAKDDDEEEPGSMSAPIDRGFDPLRLPKLVTRLESFSLPFPLTSPASQFALEWIASEDEAFLDVDNADETELIERFALVAFYNSTRGPDWIDQCGFLSSEHVCEWNCIDDAEDRGIFCGGNSASVTKVDLSFNNLKGSLPIELKLLTDLNFLELTSNKLFGTIEVLTSLSALRFFSVSFNLDVSGSIPTEIGALSNLEAMFIVGSNLNGTIPTELGNLKMLQALSISAYLVEAIPSELGRLTNAESLDLGVNRLSGQIPSELGNMKKLAELSLEENFLTGTVPEEIASLSNLSILRLDENRLEDDLDALFCSNNTLPSISVFEADCNDADLICSCCTECH